MDIIASSGSGDAVWTSSFMPRHCTSFLGKRLEDKQELILYSKSICCVMANTDT